jgi:SPP1 gp7 family putative phage head morphogenesis protein
VVNLATDGNAPVKFRISKFNRAMRHLFDRQGFNETMFDDGPIAELRDETLRCLNDAIDFTLTDGEIPEAMAASLRDDVFVFSGCKTYHELQEVSQMLVDETGQIKPLHRFIRDVKEIHPKYNEQYLEAERNFAVSSAQAAARWADIEADGDRYDLQYFTAGDDFVREDHRKLDGITLPASDRFWEQYTPPNGWRCRCGIKQVLRGDYPRSDTARAMELGDQATTSLDAEGRNRAEMFRFNPGAQKVVFPPNHPYYSNVPDAVKKRPGHE